jgi:predicted nucleic acid-binding protein
LAGEIYSKLESARLRIGVIDTAVAAIALARGLTLVTSNDKHFQRIVSLGYNLTLENWRNP